MSFLQKISLIGIISILFTPLLFSVNVRAELGVLPSQSDETKPLTSRWFVETINPGQSVNRSIRISNNSSNNTEVQLKSKDSIQTNDGTFTFKENEDENNLAGNWITLAKNSLTLSSNGSKNVDFTIQVPKDTKPGEYAAVISGQEVKKNQNSKTLDIVTRIGSRIYITVPGTLTNKTAVSNLNVVSPKSKQYQAFLISRMREPYNNLFLEMNIENQGNIFTKTKGQFTITTPTTEIIVPFERDLAPNNNSAYILNAVNKEGKPLILEVGNYKVNFTFENSPVVPYNKENLTDTNEVKTYTTEINFTQQMIDQMKIDFENLANEKNAQEKNAQEAGSKLEITDTSSINEKTDNTLLYIVISLASLCAILTGIIGYLYWRNKRGQVKK